MSCVQAVGKQTVDRSTHLRVKLQYEKHELLSILSSMEEKLSIIRSTRKTIWSLKIWNFERKKSFNRLSKKRPQTNRKWPSFLCCNLRSLKNKFDEIHETVLHHNCDLSVFTETWLNDQFHSDLLSIPGYSNIRLDRQHQKGGGILVYHRIGMCYQIIEFNNPNQREVLPFFISKSRHLIICVYHPFWQEIAIHEEVIDIFVAIISKAHSMTKGSFKITIIGDFNGLTTLMDSICKTFKLKNFVTSPTRGNAFLDCCYSSNDANYTCSLFSPLGQSDHKIFICRSQQYRLKTRPKTALSPDFSPKNKAFFHNLLSQISFEDSPPIHDGFSLNFAYDTLISSISSLLQHCFPLKKIKISHNLPWINNSIRHLIRQRDKASRNGNINLYRHYRSKVKIQIKVAKIRFSSSINNASSRKNWNKIKDIINIRKRQTQSSIQFSSQELLTFFTSISSQEIPQLDNDISCAQTGQSIFLSEAEVLKSISQSKKGGGVPFIPAWFLKDHCDILVKPLQSIFNASLNLGLVPRNLKAARITPVPKVKCPTKISDFRPITCVSPILKALERIVLEKWLKPLITNQHFKDQYAFVPLKGRGCTSALSVIYGHLVQSINRGMYCNLLLIDFSKAFDRVSSFKVVDNLLSLGASQQCVYWIYNFLHNRQVQVCQKNDASSFSSISGGTPQGSIISPVLFAIACHTLVPTTNSCLFVKYADDLSVIHTHQPNVPNLDLQHEVNNIIQWSITNGLLINEGKTNLMHISGRKQQSPPSVQINNSDIKLVESARLLGLTFTNDLKWNANTSNSIKSASKLFYHIIALKRAGLSPKTLYSVYCSLVRPLLTYSSPTTINMSQQNVQRLLKCEKRFLHLIRHTPEEPLKLFIAHLCKNFVKSVSSNEEHPFRDLLVKVEKSRTRSERTLVAPNSRSTLMKNTIISFFK